MKKLITLLLAAMLLTQSAVSAANIDDLSKDTQSAVAISEDMAEKSENDAEEETQTDENDSSEASDESESEEITFPDMPEEPEMAEAIVNAVKNGIIYGDGDGNVNPYNNIKRAEMAAIITRVCKAETEGDISAFTDVSSDKWYYSSIAKAYAMGALVGSNNLMNPDSNITFQECFTVLSQVFDLLPVYKKASSKPDPLPVNTAYLKNRLYDMTPLAQFDDATEVADWAKIYVCGIVANGGWNGVDGKITPSAYITRGQFAMVMNNLIQNYIDEPGVYTELPEGNTMIRCEKGVVLENVETEYDLYIGDSVAPNGLEIKNINIKNKKRFVVRGCATPTLDEKGRTTCGDEPGLVVTGHIGRLRLIRPYVLLNMVDATSDAKYTVEDTAFMYNAKI